jgi:hypothetical protein
VSVVETRAYCITRTARPRIVPSCICLSAFPASSKRMRVTVGRMLCVAANSRTSRRSLRDPAGEPIKRLRPMIRSNGLTAMFPAGAPRTTIVPFRASPGKAATIESATGDVATIISAPPSQARRASAGASVLMLMKRSAPNESAWSRLSALVQRTATRPFIARVKSTAK